MNSRPGGCRLRNMRRIRPHALALLWQALWVALILKLAAAIFRRSVLKSGGGRRSLFKHWGASLAALLGSAKAKG